MTTPFVIHITETGGKRAIAHLRRIQTNVPIAAKMGTKEYANRVIAEAQNIIDSDSIYHGKQPGTLANSFRLIARNDGYTIENEAEYAPYVEYGTKPHAQPLRGTYHPGAFPMAFMQRAIQHTRRHFVEDVAKEVRKALR